jgi:mono/diheme cytochrome c family protein
MRTKVAFPRTGRVALLAIPILLTFGVSAASAQESSAVAANTQKWNYTELAKVPEKARDKQNPLENDPDLVLAGGKLFQRHCAECHGMKAEGSKRAPSLLRKEVQEATPGALFWVLTNGVVWHGMPVWSKLPEPQRWQIVAFLKSFRAPSGPQGATGSE